jgi:hypothetical protein
MAGFGHCESIVSVDEVAPRFGVQVTPLEQFVQGVLRCRRERRSSMNRLRFPWLPLFIVLVTIAVAASAWWSGQPAARVSAQEAPAHPAAPDPATTVTLTAVADADIKNDYPTANFGSSETLVVRWGGVEATVQRALVRFDLGDIPANAVIDHADLTLRLTEANGGTIPSKTWST